ncbi:MAG: DNA polymerase Y family protein [Gammaproteobacteria bacterium]|nr:DNA polymerase Y family protein [Gammaproteobacteria bacterium]
MRASNPCEPLPRDFHGRRATLPATGYIPGQENVHSANASTAGALWLHLHLPQFPLEVLTRGVATQRACVLTAGEGRRRKVLLANTRAAALGIRPGMPLGAAHALGEVTVLARNERAEHQALDKLCLWALQLSPQVSPVPPDGLVLEIKGSLRLFKGMDGLLSHLRHGLRGLGYRLQHAVAPTPMAATLLARSNSRAIVLAEQDLMQHLSPLSIETLRLEARHSEALASIGVRRIGDCRRLPRDGLARRFSPVLNDMLDRLFGRAPDPRSAFSAPWCFEATLDLPWELDNAQALVVAGERLLHELVGYLRGNAAMTRHLRWRLIGRDNSHTRFEVGLTRPGRDFDHMCLLLRETLMRMNLKAPVRAIELYVDDIMRGMLPSTSDLFLGRNQQDEEAYAVFADRFRSRCGSRALRGLGLKSDHRPEHAWCWRYPDDGKRRSLPRAVDPGPFGARPLWLVKHPMTLTTRHGHPEFDGPLQLVPERERIDAGWWDGHAIARDYFIATTTKGSRLWIYEELDGERRWRLHGVFE